jgi:hypothetical protein
MAQFVEEPEAPAAEQPATTPDTFTLKVRGNEIKASRDDLIRYAELEPEEAAGLPQAALVRLAQKQLAASSYLDEVKQASKDARSAARAPGDTQPDNAAHGDDFPDYEAEGDPPSPPQDERDPLEAAIEKVQFSDPAEGAQALREALAAEEQRRAAQAREAEVAQELDREIRGFEATNAELVQDPVIGGVLYNHYVYEEILTDIAELAKAKGLTREQVKERFPDVRSALQAYTLGRKEGAFRDPKAILSTAGNATRQRFGLATTNPAAPTSPPVSDRTALKRALPPQPQRSNAPLPAPVSAAPRSPSSVVAKMRAARPGQAR